MQLDDSAIKRFWQKVEKGDGCWEWQGAPSKHGGYGTFTVGGSRFNTFQRERAHRVSYQIHFGPISSGLKILHRCDNPLCVRPDHLFPGTQGDNIRDMWAKGRQNAHFGRIK
jgi:hypothetical protein